MASRSHHGSVLCQNPTTKQFVPLPIRSMHIKHFPNETNKTDGLHGISRPKPKNLTSNGSCMRHHVRTLALGTITCAVKDSRLPARIWATCVAKTALSSPDLLGLRIWWSYELTRAHTRRRVIISSPRAGTHLPRAEEQMLMSSCDIVTPRQQLCKHLHISPSSRQRHVIGWSQRLYYSTREPTRTSIRWLWPWTSWLWPFALTFDQKSKFLTGPILLSFLRRFQFWTLFLRLKLQNWSIGTFFIVVSSKALFMASSRNLLILIQPQALIELPPWVWRTVLEIYIRHISPM